MGCTEQLVENITGYSKAKYSTWLFYRPDRLLFDAGEGVSTSLGNYIYGVEQIFLSHGHFDHIGGIPGILRSRLSSRGDKEKPLEIYYPEGCRPVEELRRYVDDSIDFESFEVRWHAVQDGESLPLRTGGKQRQMLAFRTRHIRGQLTLGYALVENRRRRKPAYEHARQDELRALAQAGTEISEDYQRRLLVFSGDAMPLDVEQVRDAHLLIHDTTFLQVRDRDRQTHATLDEAVKLAMEANCEGLLAFHVSSRYTMRELKRGIAQVSKALSPDFPIWYLEFKSGLRREPVRWEPSDRTRSSGDSAGNRKDADRRDAGRKEADRKDSGRNDAGRKVAGRNDAGRKAKPRTDRERPMPEGETHD